MIGRSEALVDQAVGHPTVSGRHARVVREGNRFYVEDLNSSNGTRVNGDHVVPFRLREITAGASVELGEMSSFTVQSLHP